MELIDKQKQDDEIVEFLNEAQLDEIVKEYVMTPVDEADRKLKMMVLSLVSDLRNARGDLHSTQEEIERQHRLLDNEVEIKERLREETAKLKEDNSALRSVMFSASIETGVMEARAIQAEQRCRELDEECERIGRDKARIANEKASLVPKLRQAEHERDFYKSVRDPHETLLSMKQERDELREELKRLKQFTKEEQQDLGHLFEDYQKECADNRKLREELGQAERERNALLAGFKEIGRRSRDGLDTGMPKQALRRIDSIARSIIAKIEGIKEG